MGSAELGAWWGVLNGIAGIAGTFAGGYIASRWYGGNEPGQMRFSAVTVAATVVFFIAFLSVPNKHVALILLALWYLALSLFIAPTYALLQRLVTDDMRATTMATIMLLYNLIGMGVGPQVVGMLSDGLQPVFAADSLRYAMLVVVVIMFGAAYHFWQVSRSVQEDLALVGRARDVVAGEAS